MVRSPPEGRYHMVRREDGNLTPVVLLDDDTDLQTLQASWDVDVREQ